MLARLAELDLLKAAHPALPWDAAVRRRLESDSPPGIPGNAARTAASDEPRLAWLLWLLPLPAGEIESIHQRLHFSAALLRALQAASALGAALPSLASMRPSGWVARLEDVPLTAVQAVALSAGGGRSGEMLENYLVRWRHVKPRTSGTDLKKRGLRPGPAFQRILRRLRDAWLDGEVHTAAEESILLEKLVGGQGAGRE
jgi:tRNA nucleotidyltransferase (CCA-adding enzyme)